MRPRNFDRDAIGQILISQGRVATHRTLKDLGVPASTITRWIGPAGPWQRLLPGVVLTHRGTPTRRELLLAALAYGGPFAVVTGPDALRALGVKNVRKLDSVYVLVPASSRRVSHGFAVIERTWRLPEAITRDGIPHAPAARAVIDTCRRLESSTEARALVAAVVQQGICDPPRLAAEVRDCARQRTAAARLSLVDVAGGVRSIAEAKARDALRQHGVAEPLWNVPITDRDGVTLLTPDGWWPDCRLAMEIDSVAWHLSPEDWRRTQRRQRMMSTAGILVLSFSPLEITEDPARFAREVAEALRTARRRQDE
jgi:hypothetical protein